MNIASLEGGKMSDVGCLMLDVGCWMLDVGCRMLDVGCHEGKPMAGIFKNQNSLINNPNSWAILIND
ncbi:MAG: hypothetical protein IPH45_07780 [Bacteroidales bacterium]|nr:hypothetical protein [Bacteroidales bacterium]